MAIKRLERAKGLPLGFFTELLQCNLSFKCYVHCRLKCYFNLFQFNSVEERISVIYPSTVDVVMPITKSRREDKSTTACGCNRHEKM